MRNRVTLPYQSRNGNSYLFDDCTSMIYQWSDLYEETLEALNENAAEHAGKILKEKYPDYLVNEAIEYITFLKEQCGAFYRDEAEFKGLPSPDEYLDYIRKFIMNQLILSVTDNCNLRCKYCIYSEEYLYTKNKNEKRMSIETAKKAVDYFFELIKPQLERNPRKKGAITFYGGEPLMNIEVVKFVIDYVNENYPNRAVYHLTTNGLLLNKENIKYFVKNNVKIFLSLDGPEQEHDRLRVKANNLGSFNEIMNNIDYIRMQYPQYFDENISIISVYDLKTDILNCKDFFDKNIQSQDVPKLFSVGGVSNRGTNYYKKFTENDLEKFNSMVNEIKDNFINNVIDNENPGAYSQLMFSQYMYISSRKRIADPKSELIPYSGTCIPGKKICINSDGSIDICERINGSRHIGNINSGLDINEILNIICEYREKVLFRCSKCPISSLCTYCFMQFEDGNHFKQDSSNDCNELKKAYISLLSEYSTILEENPNAKFQFQIISDRLDHYSKSSEVKK